MADPVEAQYEAYPYPPRDPADEAKRLIVGSPSHLVEVEHFVFQGRIDPARPFRALVAGGGTGDATVMLAQQMADRGLAGEVVQVDLSAAALGVAEARVRARGLDKVRFVQGSLLDLGRLGLGRFDYIDCCGVLHHLEDPLAGLTALVGALAEGGGLGLMVYAPYGRTGVYPAQAMLRMIAPDGPDAERIAVARRLLARLPETNWLRRNPLVGDHKALGDAGLYDLLLQARDVAFGVPQLAELLRRAGLAPLALMPPLRYEPTLFLQDGDLARRLDGLSWLARCVFAELLLGSMKTHIAYAARVDEARPAPRPDGPDWIPVMCEGDGAELARSAPAGTVVKAEFDGLTVRLPLPGGAAEILGHVDGRRSLGEIRAAIGLSPTEFARRFDGLYAVFHGLGWMFLRRSA